MIRRTLLIIPVILTVACLTACQPSGTTGDNASVTIVGKAVETNEPVEPVNDHKNYELLTSQMDQPLPVLSLELSDKTFIFSYDMLSSYLSVGTYTEMDDKLELVTDDGKFHYAFEIVDENTLKFLQKESSEIKLTDDRMGIRLEDGDLLVTNREQRELTQKTEERQDVSEWHGSYFRKGNFSWKLEFRTDIQSGQELLSVHGNDSYYRALFTFVPGAHEGESPLQSSSLEDVEGKSLTIKLNEDGTITVSGMPVPEGIYYPMESLFMPEVFSRPVYDSTLQGLERKELRILRNQFYAVHGQPFQNTELKAYFESQPWYMSGLHFGGNTNFHKIVFSDLEKRNIEAIKRAESDYDEGKVKEWKETWALFPEAPYLSLLPKKMEISLGINTSKNAKDMGIYLEADGVIGIPITATPEQLQQVDQGNSMEICMDELEKKMGVLRAANEKGTYLITTEDEMGEEFEYECYSSYEYQNDCFTFWAGSADTIMKTVYRGPVYVLKGAKAEWFQDFPLMDAGDEIRLGQVESYWGNEPDFDEKGYLKGLYYYGD